MIVFVLLIVYLPIYKFIKNKSPLIWGFFFGGGGGGGEGGFMIYPLIWLPISTLILRLFSYLGIFQDF
jgi:hypothetical protein